MGDSRATLENFIEGFVILMRAETRFLREFLYHCAHAARLIFFDNSCSNSLRGSGSLKR
jgi:hypothetical protein